MISVSDLGKSFGAQSLFSGVSIQFNPGNRYGLVGANGSGKTTLLRILSGEEAPSTGIISIPKKFRLGVLKQDHFRFEEMPIVNVAKRQRVPASCRVCSRCSIRSATFALASCAQRRRQCGQSR